MRTVLQKQTARGLHRHLIWFERVVRLVCELGMQLQMRQYDCNGAAGPACTFCAAVIVICLVRYAMAAVWSIALTLSV